MPDRSEDGQICNQPNFGEAEFAAFGSVNSRSKEQSDPANRRGRFELSRQFR